MNTERHGKLPLTVLIAVRNEARNLPKCLAALGGVDRVVVLDSGSTDGTVAIAEAWGAEVTQFRHAGGYPKKRQWALETLVIHTPWVLLLDADEVVPEPLWDEIRARLSDDRAADAFMITKGFHFLGKRMRFGGFSHSAVLLFRTGKAQFERLVEDSASGLDMEVHERVIVDGRVDRLATPLLHEDFKGLEAYIARHNAYSTWEAALRNAYFVQGSYGQDVVAARLWGNSQERRRALKKIVVRLPFESWIWFAYHYFFRLGLLEGRRGLIASQIRASYIQQVRAKMYELSLARRVARDDAGR